MKCVLVGNYGIGNIGDEALKEYFLSAFPEIEWVVVSSQEKGRRVPRLPFGIRSFFSPWWRTISAIAKADAVVFGGGSLFTDVESGKACVMWWLYAAVARLFSVPYFLVFQGVGPFSNPRWERLARRVYEGAAFVSVRDEKSLARVKAWTLKTEPVLTFDPAFALFSAHPPHASQGKILVVIPRANSDEKFFALVSQKLTNSFDSVRILLMQPDAEEKRVGERLMTMAQNATVVEIASVAQLLDEVGAAREVVCQRYHGALAALAMKVPFDIVPQGAGDKMAALKERVARGDEGTAELLAWISVGAEAFRKALSGLPNGEKID